LDREKFSHALGAYTIAVDNALRKKWSSRQTAEDYQRKLFDEENIDELIKNRQCFPPSKFCAIRYDYFIEKNFPKIKLAKISG